ncbi:hypothetical protein [Streptomyces sp. NPDC005486]|uniref:hypothetical protein n=1 Tax=Streptomyces sp. NPDC005486 TaxID=3155345 RepID=UPI0033B25D84
MDVKHWIKQAARVRQGDGYTYSDLARDLVDALGWTAAVHAAAALRGHVYGWPAEHPLHATVQPIYDRLGWEQAALLTAWFRDSRNFPQPTHRRNP